MPDASQPKSRRYRQMFLVKKPDTYVDRDGQAKRFADIDAETQRYIDMVRANVSHLIADTAWPLRQGVLMELLASMDRHEMHILAGLMRGIETAIANCEADREGHETLGPGGGHHDA